MLKCLFEGNQRDEYHEATQQGLQEASEKNSHSEKFIIRLDMQFLR